MDESFTYTRRIIPATESYFLVDVTHLLLDAITNVSGAWSFRRLLTAYAGSCCRIRRSSDNAEQDFGFAANVVDTAGIATFIGGGSGFIVTWYDQSGNAMNVTQATAAKQPQFIASGLGSLPTSRWVQADAPDLYNGGGLTRTSMFNLDEATIFSVQTQLAAATQTTTFAFFNVANHPDRIALNATYDDFISFDFGSFDAAGRVSVAQPVGWDDNPHVVEVFKTTADDSGVVIDGNTLATATGITDELPVATYGFSIGSFEPVLGLPFGGDISEVVTIRTDTGSANRTIIRKTGVGLGVSGSMGSYYGITVS